MSIKRADECKLPSVKFLAGRYFSGLALFLAALAMLGCPLLPAASAATGNGSVAPVPAADFAPAAAKVGGRFGIASSHLARFDSQDMEAEFQAMKEIQAGRVRCTFAWHDLEWQGDGVWDFAGADMAVSKARGHGVEILGILGGCPPWANGDREPFCPPLPKNLDKWAEYVRTVSSRYAGRVSAWEIWNEENIQFWQPEPDPEYYVELLRIASGEIRKADPQAKVVMGGMAGLGADYLLAAFGAGALNYVDAIAYHPYAETIGETTDPPGALLWPKEKLCRNIVASVRDYIWLSKPPRPIEVWVTEVGWSTSEVYPNGVDPETQAAYIMRTMINYASTNLDKCFIYMLRDEPEHIEDRAGLMNYYFMRKPSYYYYKTFQEVFGEATAEDAGAVTFKCSDPSALEAHCFPLPSGDLALAAWKSDNQADILSLTVKDPSFSNASFIDPLTGESRAAPDVSRDSWGRLSMQGVAIGKTPVIMRIGKLSVTSITPHQEAQTAIRLDVTVEGTGFEPGTTFRLERGGTVSAAFNLKPVSDTRITGTVGLFMVEPGVYDLVVTNPSGEEARLAGAFTVISVCGTGGGTAVIALGLMLGLVSLAASFRPRPFSRR